MIEAKQMFSDGRGSLHPTPTDAGRAILAGILGNAVLARAVIDHRKEIEALFMQINQLEADHGVEPKTEQEIADAPL